MTSLANKKKLLFDFELMRDFENHARDRYLEMSEDVIVKRAGVEEDFKQIALEEEKHVRAVERILELIEKKL